MKNVSTISYKNATGKIDYGFRNDYMFRAVLQTSKKTLTGLVSALLHINPDDVKSIEIQNPIELGKVYDDKEFILDISLLLNDDTYINLEMQVSNNNDWPERSLSYLCRSFDQLNRGQAYLDAKPVIHIGILNYTLFENAPEFYATYELQNIRTQQTYSRKLSLNVLDLTQIDRATCICQDWDKKNFIFFCTYSIKSLLIFKVQNSLLLLTFSLLPIEEASSFFTTGFLYYSFCLLHCISDKVLTLKHNLYIFVVVNEHLINYVGKYISVILFQHTILG